MNRCSLLLLVTAGFCGRALAGPQISVVRPDTGATISTIAPREFERFSDASARGYNLATAHAALALVKATNTALVRYNSSKQTPSEKRLQAELAYSIAWQKALQTWRKTTDPKAKSEILASWNAGLRDTPEVQGQIRALYAQYERAFFTEPFIKLFMATTKPTAVRAFCLVLGEYGKDTEAALLNEKFATVTGSAPADIANVGNIIAALDKLGYWRGVRRPPVNVKVAEPSPELAKLLDRPGGQIQSSYAQQHTLTSIMTNLFYESLNFKPADLPFFGFELESANMPPHIKAEIPEYGTIRQQLDAVTQDSGYTWQASGHWLNFIPKAKVSDPKYYLNLRIPGTVVVSRNSTKATSLSDWLYEHHVSLLESRDGHTLTINGARPTPVYPSYDTVTLYNPTLREYVNTFTDVHGACGWTLTATTTNPATGRVEAMWSRMLRYPPPKPGPRR